MSLNLADTLRLVAAGVADTFERQIADPAHPDCGALVRADFGIADPSGSIGLPTGAALLLVARRLGYPVPDAPDDATVIERANLAIDYCLRALRPSGLPDLLDCNYDSSPDAGFCVQGACLPLELARRIDQLDEGLAGLLAKLEQYVRRLAMAMTTGGFHTPNHRWVMTAAMTQALALFPDMPLRPTIDAYLAEGFDIDEEGFYIERSAAVYDAICDRSLLLIDQILGCPAAGAAARKNLRMNLHMMHADGTVETGLSHRQDYGTRPLPATLATGYLLAGLATGEADMLGAAHWLWKAGEPTRRLDPTFAAYAMMRHGERKPEGTPPPSSFSVHLPKNEIWRVRRERLSASVFGGATRLMTLAYGEAEITAVKISQSYFGVGRFVANELTVTDGVGRLLSTGETDRHRPGYELPLGRPVPAEKYFDMLPERDWRRVPPCRSELIVTEAEGGLDLRYHTLDGITGVTAQVALDFPVGGIWETGDTCLRPTAGQVLFLKGGTGRMVYGHDAIEIGPGANAHLMFAMRDAETAPSHVRVLLTFKTPVDHVIRVRCMRVH